MFADIHDHCAWDVDDGISSVDDALSLLRSASEDGVHAIVATPHLVPALHLPSHIAHLHARIDELALLADPFGIRVFHGCEFFLNTSFLDMIDLGIVPSLNASRYLLVEFDVRRNISLFPDADDMLFELIVRGYVPLIAHVERYFHSDIDLARVRSWIDCGCKIQVNRTSILGDHGRCSQRNAFALLDHGLVHVVASDAHSCRGSRICKFSDVYRLLSRRLSVSDADLLCSLNPDAVIADADLAHMQHSQRSLLSRACHVFRKR